MPPQVNRVHGFLKSFPKGIDSYVDPLLLPPDQLSFAVNATMRGDFVTQRPPHFTQTLKYDKPQTGTDFQAGLYQGACYYRSGDDGYIMVSVAGQLFQVKPNGDGSATVSEIDLNTQIQVGVTPPGKNSTVAAQNWLWQAEGFVIWSDGVGLPIFYNGNSVRRSLGANPVPLGVIEVTFDAPAPNQYTSNINLLNQWTGGLGPVLIGAALYNVVSYTGGIVGGYFNLGLNTISAGTGQIQSQTTFYTNSKLCGTILTATDDSGVPITVFPPMPVVGTSPASFTMNAVTLEGANPAIGTVIYDVGYFMANRKNTEYLASSPCCYTGKVINVNGQDCTINSFTEQITFNVIASVLTFTCTPNSNAATGTAIQGSVIFPGESPYVGPGSKVYQYTALEGSYTQVASLGAMNGGTPSVPNYFRLTLSQPFQGNQGDTLHVGSGNTLATFQVTKIISADRQTIQCVMTNPPPPINTIPISSATPTLATLVYDDTIANPATLGVATYPKYNNQTPAGLNASVTPTAQFTMQCTVGQNNPIDGMIVQIVESDGSIGIFQIYSAPPPGGSTAPSFQIQNITDTEGRTVVATTVVYSIPELPICRMGCYGMGRNWVALQNGVSYVVSDIVGAITGTQPYNFTDSVLRVSQNYFLANGGTFQISGSGEHITAMAFSAQLDASLGQGPLQVFTDDTVFSNYAPPDISTWANLTTPIQVEGLIGSGAISQDAVVNVNGDLIFRLSNGGVQSMLMARLDFNRWGNTPISREITRLIASDDPTLLPFTSMGSFNNRLLMSCNHVQMARGVAGKSLAVMNFDANSSLAGKSPSIWEGQWTGLNILKTVTGYFNGSQQCFALCLSGDGTQIQLVQIQLDGDGFDDDGATTIIWSFETPVLLKDPPNAPRQYKRLVNGDFSVDGISENVFYAVSYRADQNSGWTKWYSGGIGYQGASDPGYRRRVGIGQPPAGVYDATNNQPLREGYNFQLKFELTGAGKITDIRIAADLVPEPEFAPPK